MLLTLLELIGQGKLQRIEDLAAALDTSPALLEQMLDDLVRMGYLVSGPNACATASCNACPGDCFSSQLGNIWVLTPKGSRALRREAPRA